MTIDVCMMADGMIWGWCDLLPGMMFEAGTVSGVVNLITGMV